MGEQDPGRKRAAQVTKDFALSPQTFTGSENIREATDVFTRTPQSQFNSRTASLTELEPVRKAETREEPVQLIRTREDIGQMKEAKIVHLSGQSVVNAAAIQSILDPRNYPYLEEIEISDRLAARLVRRKILELIQEAKEDRGITLVKAGYKGKTRAEQKPGRNQAEKKQLFEKLEPKKLEDYKFMKKHPEEFPEVVIAEAYFAGKSFAEIAQAPGFTESSIRRRFACLANWAGAEYIDKAIVRGGKNLNARINRQRRKDKPSKTDKKFIVEGETPPQTLPQSRWKTWEAVMQRRTKAPGLFARLAQEDPVGFKAVAHFCHFQEVADSNGQFLTQEEIAKAMGYSCHQSISLRKKMFLRRLGVPEEI